MILEKKFYIRGMHCAACSAGSEKIMRRQKGVVSADVNLTMELATVKYEAEEIKLSQIKAAVAKLGYTTEDYEDLEALHSAEEKKQKERLRARTKLITALI
jgi:Cu+-exporting ATPase